MQRWWLIWDIDKQSKNMGTIKKGKVKEGGRGFQTGGSLGCGPPRNKKFETGKKTFSGVTEMGYQ